MSKQQPQQQQQLQQQQQQQQQLQQQPAKEGGAEFDLNQVIQSRWFQDFEAKRNNKINELLTKNQQQEYEIQELKDQLTALQNFSAKSASEIRRFQNQDMYLDKLNEDNAANLKKFRASEQEKNAVIESMQGQIRHLDNKIIALQRRAIDNELITKMEQASLQQSEDFKRILQQKNDEIAVLRKGSDTNKIQQQYDEFVSRMKHMEGTITNLMNAISQKDAEIFKCKREVERILDEHSGESEVREHRKAQEMSKAFDKQLKEMNEKFMKELVSKDIQIKELLDEASLHQNKIEIIKNHHQTLNQNIQNDKDSDEIAFWKQKCAEMQKEVEQVQDDKKNIQRIVHNAQEQEERLVWQPRLADQQNQIEQLNAQLKQSQSHLHPLTREVESLSSNLQQMRLQYDAILSENDSLKRQLAQNTNTNEVIAAKQEEINGLRQTIFFLTKKEADPIQQTNPATYAYRTDPLNSVQRQSTHQILSNDRIQNQQGQHLTTIQEQQPQVNLSSASGKQQELQFSLNQQPQLQQQQSSNYYAPRGSYTSSYPMNAQALLENRFSSKP